MSLVAGCPRCRAAAPLVDGTPRCPVHGVVSRTLWRPEDDAEISYDVFVDHLGTAGTFPTYLPWPMSPGWSVTDFAVAADERTWATATCVSGTSELDGPVDVFVVAEEPGTGLGARCAGIDSSDPGREVGDGQPTVRVRIGSQSVSLWAVSTASSDDLFDRSVFVGEANGRWLWLVLRPASAMLLLRDDWILRDVSGGGPLMVEMPFVGPGPAW